MVLSIHVPKARREDKPIYLDDKIFDKSFRRNGEEITKQYQREVTHLIRDQTGDKPVIEEQYHPDRTILTLPFTKRAEKASRKNKQKKQAEKTSESGKTQANKEKVIAFVSSGGEYSAAEIAEMLDLSPARTRVILKEMCDEGHIESTGGTKGRRYRMK